MGKKATGCIKNLPTNYRCTPDKAYDVKELDTFIVEEIKAIPFIPINPRNTKDDKTFGPHDLPLCETGLEIKSVGTWTEGNRQRLKFRCPVKSGKKFAKKYGATCPADNPRFDTGKCYGCTKYQDITDNARSRVPRDSKKIQADFQNQGNR